jgi:hypothetical protein
VLPKNWHALANESNWIPDHCTADDHDLRKGTLFDDALDSMNFVNEEEKGGLGY